MATNTTQPYHKLKIINQAEIELRIKENTSHSNYCDKKNESRLL